MDAREQRELRLECLRLAVDQACANGHHCSVKAAAEMYEFIVGPKHEPVNVARGPDGKFVSMNEDPPEEKHSPSLGGFLKAFY